MRNWTATVASALALNLPVKAAVAAEPAEHARIEVGASFLFSQDVRGGTMRNGTYHPRLDAYGRNSAGGLIFTIASGPKKEIPGLMLQIAYSLAPGSCVVDVMNGAALMMGEHCDRPLPQKWTIETAGGGLKTCTLRQPHEERVQLPAGDWDTTRFECRGKGPAPGQQRVDLYWYAPSLGAMVKAVHRTVDAAGTELSAITEQLVSYQPH